MIIKYDTITDYSKKSYKVKLENGKELFIPKSNVINYNKVTKNLQLKDWYYETIKSKL